MKGYHNDDILECTKIGIGLNTYCIILFNILISVGCGAVDTLSLVLVPPGTVIIYTVGFYTREIKG